MFLKSATSYISFTSEPRSGLKELITEVSQQVLAVHALKQGANSKEDTSPHHPKTEKCQITAQKNQTDLHTN